MVQDSSGFLRHVGATPMTGQKTILVAMILAMALVGCGRPAGPIFAVVEPSLRWPAPPEPPRIRYVGQLASGRDLKPAESGWLQLKYALLGRAPTIRLVSPVDVAHQAGKLYVADPGLGAVVLFDLDRRRTTLITGTGNSQLRQPTHLALGPQRLFVSDSAAGCVVVFDRQGRYRSTLGRGRLNRPAGLCYCPRNQRLYVADVADHKIVSFSLDGEDQQAFGQRGSGPGQLNFPTFIRWHRRLGLLVTDTMNFRIQRFDTAGRFLGQFGRKGDAAGDLALPKGLACDGRGHIFVVDAHFENVQIFDDAGQLLLAFGLEGRGPGQFWLPTGIFIDRADRIWVADTYNRRVQVFDLIKEQGG